MVIYPKKAPLPPDPYEKVDGYSPYLLRDPDRRRRLLENICKRVSKASPVKSAFIAEGVNENTYNGWLQHYRKECREYEGENKKTPLMEFFDAVYHAHKNNELSYAEVLHDKAIYEKDTDSAKYLLERVHKWKDTTQVEIDTSEDSKIELNIVPMVDENKPEEEEDEE